MLRRRYVAAVLALFHALLLFAALNLLAAAALRLFAADPVTRAYGARPGDLALVYPGRSLDQVRELLRETWTRPVAWEAFTNSRERRYSGRYVNVHPAGFRVSSGREAWPPDRARTSVFVFGGSTTFGYGVADGETIVSALQRFLDARLGAGRVACYNFGRAGFYSSGERALFHEMLTAGTVPQVAVFVDGINEFAFGVPFAGPRLRAAVNHPVRGALTVLAERLPVSLLVARWKARPAAALPEDQLAAAYGDPALLDGRIERYLANRRTITASAAAWGVRPLFVWQPAPTYNYDLRFHLFRHFDFGANNYSRFGYPRIARRLQAEPPRADFLWAADLQRGVRAPLYVDHVHYSAAMCTLVAEEVGRALLGGGLLAREH